MGSSTSGNRSKFIDYEKQERVCLHCGRTVPFAECNWDYRRNCPRSWCKVCTRKISNKRYHVKSMKGIAV